MTLRFRLGRVTEKLSILHCALENRADLHVNEHHKIRHYRGRSTEEKRKKTKKKEKNNAKSRFFCFARCIRKLALYSDVIHLFDWKSSIEHDGGV